MWCLIITLANLDRFSKFFHQLIRDKILYVHTHKDFTSPKICCYITLWKSKIQTCCWFWQHPQQTVDMFVRTFCLTTVKCQIKCSDCLKTAHTDWLTDWLNILKFVRRRLKSTAERCSVCWTLLHHVIFFTMIVFAPSSFFLYATLHVLYTYSSIISSAIFLWQVHFMCCTHTRV